MPVSSARSRSSALLPRDGSDRYASLCSIGLSRSRSTTMKMVLVSDASTTTLPSLPMSPNTVPNFLSFLPCPVLWVVMRYSSHSLHLHDIGSGGHQTHSEHRHKPLREAPLYWWRDQQDSPPSITQETVILSCLLRIQPLDDGRLVCPLWPPGCLLYFLVTTIFWRHSTKICNVFIFVLAARRFLSFEVLSESSQFLHNAWCVLFQ